MDDVAALQLDASVETAGTNWEFVGTHETPAWENAETGHHLIIDESSTAEFDYRVRLNHERQARPWWTINEVDFAPELIPMVEWILSAPDDALHNRELVVTVLEPFWSRDVAQHSSNDESSPSTP